MTEDDLSLWETIRLYAGASAAAIATMFIALGVDFGFTLSSYLAFYGYEDSLELRATLIGLGVAIFVILYIVSTDPESDSNTIE